MNDTRQLIPAAGLLATIVMTGHMVVQLDAQTAPAGDFRNAAIAEVRDAQGAVVLSGPFQSSEEDDEEVERKAVLTTTAGDADAGGEAEVEFARNAPATQEVEFSIHNLAPGATFTFVIDGTTVATATTNARGRAEVEVSLRSQ